MAKRSLNLDAVAPSDKSGSASIKDCRVIAKAILRSASLEKAFRLKFFSKALTSWLTVWMGFASKVEC